MSSPSSPKYPFINLIMEVKLAEKSQKPFVERRKRPRTEDIPASFLRGTYASLLGPAVSNPPRRSTHDR